MGGEYLLAGFGREIVSPGIPCEFVRLPQLVLSGSGVPTIMTINNMPSVDHTQVTQMLRMSQQVLLGLDPDKVNPAVSWVSETLVLAVCPWEAK
jgi:hypothetical protein